MNSVREWSREEAFDDPRAFWDAARSQVERGDCDFSGVEFPPNQADGDDGVSERGFSGVEFTAERIDFTRAVFHDVVCFDGAVFHDVVCFDGAVFCNVAYFGHTEFRNDASFKECKFVGRAMFAAAEFGDYANFEGTWFHGVANFHQVTVGSYFLLGRATFCSDVWLGGIRVAARIKLDNLKRPYRHSPAVPETCPKKSSNRLSKPLTGDRKKRGVPWCSEKRCCQTVCCIGMAQELYSVAKRWAGDYGHDKDAGRYHMSHRQAMQWKLCRSKRDTGERGAGEGRDLCWKKKLFPWEWALDYFFGRIIFGYGESPLRLASAAVVVIVGFAVVYLGAAHLELGEIVTTGIRPVPLDNFWDALYFSGVTFTTLGYGDYHPQPGGLRFAAFAEAFIGAGLMAAFVVVLMRKYVR